MIYSYFKFVSLARKDILENGMIRFAPIGSFNDPFELEPVITPLSRKYLEYKYGLNEADRCKIEFTQDDYDYSNERYYMLEEYKKKYREKISQYGVLSLSTNEDVHSRLTVSPARGNDPRKNILMWSHYANDHKGFVIEFTDDFIKDAKIKKVSYSEERDYLTFEDIDDENFEHIFFKKSNKWNYEEEYRCVFPLKKAKIIQEKKDIMEMVKFDGEFGFVQFIHARLDDFLYFIDFYHDDGKSSNNPDHPLSMQTIPTQLRME